MKLLLTSSGIANPTLGNALSDLLGKPIAQSNALFIPTAVYPFPGGPGFAWKALNGQLASPLARLDWQSLGLLELTALPSIQRSIWSSSIRKTDALLVWGGDVLYLSYWLKHSGLADLLRSLDRPPVYVGVSAGSMVTASTFAETYGDAPGGDTDPFSSADIVFETPRGELRTTLVTTQGLGLVDFALIPHLDHPDHPDASLPNAEKWAARLPVPVYAIDDQTAIKVNNGAVEIVSEGNWKLFTP